MSKVSHIVLATGGTGGHIYPAVAIAKELLHKGYQVTFIGQTKGMEARVIPQEGFNFYGVHAGKWRRGEFGLHLISEPFKAFLGFFEALRHLRLLKPRLVVGFGGFASFPTLAAASLLHIPIVLHEANAFPGKVTRWFAGRAELVLISTLEVKKYLTKAKNILQVGLPIREVSIDKLTARQKLGLPEGLMTFVMGGSQGSVTLNNYVPKAFENLEVPNHFVLHSSGKPWYPELSKKVSLKNYYIKDYVDATLAWAAADVAITRAGISTLTEAAFYGVPLVMIPLPTSAENHQYHNAKVVEVAGAGKVVEESGLSNLKVLKKSWQELLEPQNNKLASQAASQRHAKGAAKDFAKVLENLILASSSTTAIEKGQ